MENRFSVRRDQCMRRRSDIVADYWAPCVRTKRTCVSSPTRRKNFPPPVPLTGSEPYKTLPVILLGGRSCVLSEIRQPPALRKGGWYGDRSAKRAFLSNDEAGCSSASSLDEGDDDVGARLRCAAKQGADGRHFSPGWGKRSPAPWTGPRGR